MQLETMPGNNTRPTTDRIKETLFNMMADDVIGCRFLDLFAGSGQIGIEALSRGAAYACFIEQHRKALDCIRHNLTKTRLEEESYVMATDVLSGLGRLKEQEPFSIIFMDPPYHLGIEAKVLQAIQTYGILAPDGYIVIEADLHTDTSFVAASGYRILKEKCYKTNKHIFVAKDE
jgi:16S rRNA (guanine966-N2)-methyltransferase